jgi:hypothetical protein
MKKTLIAVAVGLSFMSGLYAQGTVDFRNKVAATATTPALDAPVFDSDGTTKLSGANFFAQVWFSATQAGSFAPITDTAAVFRTGAGAGYWNAGIDSGRVLPGITAGSAAWIQIRVWDSTFGASPDVAKAAGGKWGDSNIFQVTNTGGSGNPPGLPAVLAGLTSFSMQVPEPSTIALGVLGLGALLLRRRL